MIGTSQMKTRPCNGYKIKTRIGRSQTTVILPDRDEKRYTHHMICHLRFS